MCGLFGMIGPGITLKDFDIMKHLGFISMIRGTDAAGIFETNTKFVGSKKNRFSPDEMRKVNGDWSYLLWAIEQDKHSGLMCNVNHDLVMGHVRWATRGAYNEANAHPFTPGNIVGMHNGTLVDKQYNLNKDKTDSEAMFEDIAKRGMVDVLTKLDPKSAYAISMYDRGSKVLYFARNELRPLHFALNEDRNVLYWASEPWFLSCALARHGIKFRSFTIKPNIIVAVQPNSIRSDMPNVFKVVYNKENVEKLVEKIAHHEVKKEVKEEKKEEPKTEVRSSSRTTVTKIYDLKDTDDKKVSEHFVHCNCGKHRLNLFDSYMIRKSGRFSEAISIPLKYSQDTGTFECPFSDQTGVAQ